MSRIAPALMTSASPRAIMQGQPGTNGYWRRQIWDRPGTFTWTATKDGKVKIQAIGAGSGGSMTLPGNPGHYGEKTLNVLAGQTLTIVVGTGGDGSLSANMSTPGGTTSISGTPVGGTPLVLPGAPGVSRSQSNFGTPTSPSGPWDKSFAGGVGSALSNNMGSPASASPFGPGVHADQSSQSNGGVGGCGWGGPSRNYSGASSHRPGVYSTIVSAWGKVAKGGFYGAPQETLPYWDLEDVDSGGAVVSNLSSGEATSAGPGAGGARGATYGSTSLLGGGTAFANRDSPPQSGNGAGGVGGSNNDTYPGGKGGNGYVQLFWDEVA